MVNRYIVEFRAKIRRYGGSRTDSLSVLSTTAYAAKERVIQTIKNDLGCDVVVWTVLDEKGNIVWLPNRSRQPNTR